MNTINNSKTNPIHLITSVGILPFHIVTIALILLVMPSYAQNHVLLQKFQLANSKANMSYEYRAIMRDMHNAKDIDSIKGCLYVRNGAYVDSNNYCFTARVGDDYCMLDFEDQTATIASIKQVVKKLGSSVQNDEQNDFFHITDSLLKSQGNLHIDSSNAKYYRLKARLKNYPISYLQIDFWRSNYKMAAAYYEFEERDHSNPIAHYLTRMYLFKINQNSDDKIFSLNRIFNKINNKIVMNKRYSKYKIIPIQ